MKTSQVLSAKVPGSGFTPADRLSSAAGQSATLADVEHDLVEIFKQLADGTRLKVLLMLMRESELNVSTLCKRLDHSQPAVSHHLALLRMAGLVQARRSGKNIFYSIRRERFHFLMDLLFRAIQSDGGPQISFDSFVLSRDHQPAESGTDDDSRPAS